MSNNESVKLNFPECLAEDFPQDLPLALAATEAVIASIEGADFRALARNSPALDASVWQWSTYLRCSMARMVHAAAALRERRVQGGRLLDVGAYFGNFSLMFARQGFQVDAIDAFSSYAPALDGPNAVLRAEGVRLLDFVDVGRELEQMASGQYDVVLCTGVIEHVPHTPRFLLEALDRVLRPGGHLIVDTPNLTHLYNRQKFARGESVMADLPAQYYSARPFEGHHREYSIAELVWMLRQLRHADIRVEAFNYSAYEQATLLGRDVVNHWAMVQDPTMREYLLSVSTKPAAMSTVPCPARVDDVDWAATLVDPERHWQRALPEHLPAPTVSVAGEQMLIRLQAEIDRRDVLLAESHAALQEQAVRQRSVEAEVNRRDALMAELEQRLQSEIGRRDQLLAEKANESTREVAIRDELLATRERYFRAEIERRDLLLSALSKKKL